MFDFYLSEAGIRFSFFAGILVVMAIWESIAPRRSRDQSRITHWSNNIGLSFLNTVVVRFVAPIGAVGFAMIAESNGWGLFHLVSVPYWIAVPICVIALDLTVYVQHVLFHSVPFLWRLHMVHHADTEFDVTTGLRFHTIEILLSLGLKCIAIVILGAPPLAVLIFEVLLNVTSMFNHSNIQIPRWIDRILRLLIVTPDMHRVHHSIIRHETNSNFGFNLPWWDFLFHTYRDQPTHGHTNMTIGLPEYRDRRYRYLHWMLALPFIGKTIFSRSDTSKSITHQIEQSAQLPVGRKNS